MTFRIGQRVTLIREVKWRLVTQSEIAPIFGSVYTIRDMVRAASATGLIFEEIRNVPRDGELECGFDASVFRPVVEPELPAELTALLDSKNHKPLPEHVPGIEAFV